MKKLLCKCKNPKNLANWILSEFTGRLKEVGRTILTSGIPPEHVAALVNLIEERAITGRIAKSIADEMIINPGTDPVLIVANNPDYEPLYDLKIIEGYAGQAVQENSQSVEDYKKGKRKPSPFLSDRL